MTGNQMMDYYVRPRHIYSHSRTCTHSGLCRRPSRLMASHIWYLLDCASVQEIQLSWLDSSVYQISSAIIEILIHYISSAFMEIMILCISSSWRFWSIYIVRGDEQLYHILYYAYSWPSYSYVSRTATSTCSYVQSLIIVLYWLDGWVFH